MGLIKNIFMKLTPVRSRTLVEVEGLALQAITFTLEDASSADEADLISVNHHNLLPSSTIFPDSDYITISEASEIFGISSDRLRKLAREGLIDAKKLSNIWLIHRISLNKYLKS